MVDRLTNRTKQISLFPFSGEIVPEYNAERIREVIEYSYRLIYLVENESIYVLSVIHGAIPLPDSPPQYKINRVAAASADGSPHITVQAKNENPLGFAMAWKQIESIRLLVHTGADINDTLDSGPNRTQLDSAELSSWSEGADLLRLLGGKRSSELAERSNDAQQRKE